MENIKLAVITKDKDYGRALGLALVEVYKSFTVTLFQSVPIHSKLEEFDLVLKDFEKEDSEPFIYLVEKPSMTEKNYEDKRFRLYKYSNVRQLAGELLFIYTALTGRKAVPVKNQNIRIIAFCSAEGGVGCTSAAMAFARELKRFKHKRTIYISMEELDSTLEYMEPFPEGKSINEYLYHLFDEEGKDRFPFIESFLVFDSCGVDAFLPSPGRNVLKSLGVEEIQYFMESVMDMGRYDMIVLDLGSSLDKNTICCYEMANRICFVARGEEPQYKEERLLEYLTFLKGERFLEKIGRIANWYVPSQGESSEDEVQQRLLPSLCRFPEDPEAFSVQRGLKSISSDSAFGKAVGDLADLLFGKI